MKELDEVIVSIHSYSFSSSHRSSGGGGDGSDERKNEEENEEGRFNMVLGSEILPLPSTPLSLLSPMLIFDEVYPFFHSIVELLMNWLKMDDDDICDMWRDKEVVKILLFLSSLSFQVMEGGPCEEGGVEEGDILLQLANLKRHELADDDDIMRCISSVVQASLSQPLPIIVKRNNTHLNLTLTPHIWEGNGVLGCHLSPLPEEIC